MLFPTVRVAGMQPPGFTHQVKHLGKAVDKFMSATTPAHGTFRHLPGVRRSLFSTQSVALLARP